MRAVLDAPMREKMCQAFLRDVTGKMDVGHMTFARMQPGVLLVIAGPSPEDRLVVHVATQQERGLL